jgi:hypothetical protein
MSRIEIVSDTPRKSKFLLLKFPCELALAPFSDPSKQNELSGNLEIVKLNYQRMNRSGQVVTIEVPTARVVFRVSIMSKERPLELGPKKRKLSEQLPDSFASMSIS